MKKQLEKMLTDAQAMLERAEEYCDSENEKTADKYADIAAELENLVAVLEGTIECFNTD